jgi:hypothetical protein
MNEQTTKYFGGQPPNPLGPLRGVLCQLGYIFIRKQNVLSFVFTKSHKLSLWLLI